MNNLGSGSLGMLLRTTGWSFRIFSRDKWKSLKSLYCKERAERRDRQEVTTVYTISSPPMSLLFVTSECVS